MESLDDVIHTIWQALKCCAICLLFLIFLPFIFISRVGEMAIDLISEDEDECE